MESLFILIVALVSILGGFGVGFAGIFLNYRYPKSEHERMEQETIRLRRELQSAQDALTTWRARAENCEGMVQRMAQGTPNASGSAISISGSTVTVRRDMVGGDSTKRDEMTAGGDSAKPEP